MFSRSNSLSYFRRVHGHTQATLAKAVGVARETVARWENGTQAPSPDLARAVARLLDTDAPRLFPHADV